jgi:phosphoglycolate phosphatase-like HAD superfamily hydrolase
MYDCALFDIDGVLVDIRRSYNAAIKKTVVFMIREFTGRTFRGLVTDQIILKFRQTGGFNNDTDTSYAITLAMLANPQKSAEEGRRFLAKVAENADESGIDSVEKYLASFGVEKWKRKLEYPAPVRDSVLARVFDELFYGPELFRKQNHLEPKYSRGRPLIQNDRLVVSRQTMKRLDTMFSGKLAIVSGRSRLAADYSLGPLMKYFDPVASVFLEDEKREYAKPNIFAIRHAMGAMNARTAAYAGDSAEDLLMAKRAEKDIGVKIDFVGIYGYSAEPERIAAGFRKEGVVAIANINQLPRTLKAHL